MQPSNVTDLLFQQLNFRGEKQKVISSNIANLDTPDYKTKDLKFQNELEKSNSEAQLRLLKTHSNHLPLINKLNIFR
jgi:flagellar basal-body rod protein FlgB